MFVALPFLLLANPYGRGAGAENHFYALRLTWKWLVHPGEM